MLYVIMNECNVVIASVYPKSCPTSNHSEFFLTDMNFTSKFANLHLKSFQYVVADVTWCSVSYLLKLSRNRSDSNYRALMSVLDTARAMNITPRPY